MNGASLNILQDRLEKLKVDFPEIFTEGKIDIEKFKATFTDNINFNNERYVLNWAGKSDAFKVLQIQTTATLNPQPEESVNFDTTENIFIEGENLEVLKVLQKSYYGKIKCIIIDPPYNTGNDSFIYPDSFKENKADYEKRIGEKDEEGYLMKEGMFRKNSKDSGHYHSNWLSMMYPRLFLAKNLLREDGVIFVHIDDNEVHNLTMILNEIFGEENFVGNICWFKKRKGSFLSNSMVSLTEYILVYKKRSEVQLFGDETDNSESQPIVKRTNAVKSLQFPANFVRTKLQDGTYKSGSYGIGTSASFLKNDIEVENGVIKNQFEVEAPFVWSQSFLDKEIANGTEVLINTSNFQPRVIRKNNDSYKAMPSFIDGREIAATNEDAYEFLKDIFKNEGIFSYSKPTNLVKKLITSISYFEKDTLILDFFGGSGTTAQAVLELNKEDGGNRKFILVQLPEQCDENSEAYKAGYKTIADISKERIRRVIKKIETEQAEAQKKKEGQLDFGNKAERKPLDLGFKAFKLSPSNFKIWRGNEINEENLVQQLDAFTNPVREGSEQENMLFELMLKAGYLLTDKVEKKKNFYSINNNELIIAIDSIDQASIDNIIALQPKKVIALDILFKDNDQLKTNTVLQMKDAGVDFKTI